MPSLLIFCLCGKIFRTRAGRANDVSHIISGVLHSWMRLSFVCLVPMDLRGKTPGPPPQVKGPQDRDESARPSAFFGCCTQERRERSRASRECAPANRPRTEQRSRPIQGSTGLAAHRGDRKVDQPDLTRKPSDAGIGSGIASQACAACGNSLEEGNRCRSGPVTSHALQCAAGSAAGCNPCCGTSWIPRAGGSILCR